MEGLVVRTEFKHDGVVGFDAAAITAGGFESPLASRGKGRRGNGFINGRAD